LDHVLPVALDEVNVTELPEQKVVAPLAEIVGIVGTGFTVTTVGVELAVHVPFDTVTVYEPL
jgi:phosphotransferase system IIA component